MEEYKLVIENKVLRKASGPKDAVT